MRPASVGKEVVEAIKEFGGHVTINDLDEYFDKFSRKQISNATFNAVKFKKIKRIEPGVFCSIEAEPSQNTVQSSNTVHDPIPNQPSLSASEIGNAIIGMIERLKQENKKLSIDLRHEVEIKESLQQRLNTMKMSQRTLSIKEITGR